MEGRMSSNSNSNQWVDTQRSSRSAHTHTAGRTVETLSGSPSHPHMTLYNSVIEEKIIIEQVDSSRERQAAEARARIEAQFQNCSRGIEQLLDWLTSIEQQLASQETVRETLEEVKRQILSVKSIRDDLDSHSVTLHSHLNTIRELLANGGHVISAQQLSTLDKNGKQVKSRFDSASECADNLMTKLTSCHDELRKYKTETTNFTSWMKQSCHTLQELEPAMNNLNKAGREQVKEFVSDVIAHQGDLRFLTMSAQRFLDESKAHLHGLNHFRNNLPRRLGKVPERESRIQEEVTDLTETYQKLLARANALFDKLAMGTRRKEFEDALNAAVVWLRDVTPRAQKILSEPISTEPKQLEAQLSRARTLQSEVLAQGKLIDEVRQTANNLLNSMEELSPADRAAITSTAADVEGRYKDLVEKMSDQVQSLSSASGAVQKILANMELLASILQREEKRKPKSIIPESKVEVERVVRVLESILSVLAENQGLLDSTRGLINELLRKAEGPDLSRTFLELDTRWKNLVSSCRSQLDFLANVKEFHESHDLLAAWLKAKEKMLAVLGPIASTPAVLASQLQQVQIMREEFGTQKPALDGFNAVGDKVLAQTNPSNPDGRRIDGKLVAINAKWNELLHKLDDFEGRLREISEASGAFFDNLNRLQNGLNKVSDELDQLAADKGKISLDEMRRRLADLGRALGALKPLLESVQNSGEALCDILDDPASKADIRQKVDQVGRLYDQCQKKLDRLLEELDSNKKEMQEFDAACQAAQGWLQQMLAQLGDRLLVSADRDTLKGQVSETEALSRQVAAKESEISSVINKGRELASAKATGKNDQRVIVQNVDVLQKSWDKLNAGLKARQTRLQSCTGHCQKYDHTAATFLSWLSQAEARFEGLRLHEFNRTDIDRQLKEVNALKNDIWRHTGEFDASQGQGKTFLDACDRDKEGVAGELRDMKIRWEALNNALLARIQELEDFAGKLGQFNDHVRDVKKVLDRCEDQLDATDDKDPKILQKLRAIAEEAARLEQPLGVVKDEGSGLCRAADGQGCDSVPIRDTVDDLLDRFGALQAKLDGRGSELEAAMRALAALVKRLSADLAGLEDELNNMKGVGRDLPTVKGQIRDMETFERKVADKAAELDIALAQHPDSTQLQDLKKVLGRIKTKASGRESELDKTLARLEEFYRLYDSVDGELTELISEEKSLFGKGIGGDDASIRALQKKFDEFRSRYVGPMGKAVDDVNKMGNVLIQSAAHGVNTGGLRTDLDKLNDKWNGLKKTLADRQRAFEQALLKAGNFKDALQKFMDWLRHMDALLVDDGRVHGDVPTVTALIKEHKKVEDQLQGRAAQLQDILAAAEPLIRAASPDAAAKLESQVKDAKSGFEKVKMKCDARSRKLDGALKEAQQLEKAVHSILDWLALAEKKKQALSGPLPTDEKGAMKMLDDQEAFMRDMAAKERDKNATLDLAKSILAKAHPNAVNAIKHWIATIESKWNDLALWAKQRHEKLQAHLASLRDNTEMLNELLAWLKKREDTLSRLELKPLPEQVEEVRQLILEHNAFMREVVHRQPDVDFVCGPKVPGRPAPSGFLKAGARSRGHSPSPGRDVFSADLFPHIGPKFDSTDFHHKNPRVKAIWDTWKAVWAMAWERQRRLRLKYTQLVEKNKVVPFNWEDWRKRFLKFFNHNKQRVKDLFSKFDRHSNGLIPREKFTGSVTNSGFPTTELELDTVADMFEHGDDNLFDYPEFMAALRPDWRETKPVVEDVLINDEIERQVKKCTCKQKFRVYQVAEGKYRFGESQKLRLVRILRTTVMVRVGGGWVSLEEFLIKNDPCRAKGRTNIELREQLVLPEGASQTMQAFVSKPRGGRSPSPTMAGPIKGLQERSIRSTPMSRQRHGSGERPASSLFSDIMNARMSRSPSPGNF